MTNRIPLTLLAIVKEPGIVGLFRKVFGENGGDRLIVATDMAEGLAFAASEQPDIAFVDVSLGHNAGLALIHHVRAVAANAVVYALASVQSLEVGAQAVALGGAGLILMPPSGDELLLAASEVRAKLGARREHEQLKAQADLSARGGEYMARVAALADVMDRAEAAKALAPIFGALTGAAFVAIYLPASEGSSELVRSAVLGTRGDAPTFVDEAGLRAFARDAGLEMVPLTIRQIAAGTVLLGGLSDSDSAEGGRDPLMNLIAGQAATMLAFLGERERSNRGAIKDRTTSAYTFAYFVDIAGREIDKARRYGRRFALATITMEEATSEIPPDLAEAILSAVRDTDVLARVDEREFYLLMPETGGVGAQNCRRRVLEHVAASKGRMTGPDGAEVTMGVATYPHDGMDLSRLLRAAKRRADRARQSPVRSLGLVRMGFGSIVDELVKAVRGGGRLPLDEGVYPVDLPVTDTISVAVSAVTEALRAGPAFVAVAHHPGLGLSSALGATFGHDRDGLSIHTLDLRAVPGLSDLEAVTVIAEQGSYLLAGRMQQGIVRAVHASDPLLVDLVARRFGQAAGVRLLD